MFDINKLDSKELIELKNKINLTLAEKMRTDDSFYSKIIRLKEDISSLVGKKVALTIDGEDIFMRLHFKKGVNFIIDTFDSTAINVDEYNEEQYDQLYIESLDKTDGLYNFYIPIYSDFVATKDVNILKDEPEEELDYENVLLIIRMDTIDYIFTDDVDWYFLLLTWYELLLKKTGIQIIQSLYKDVEKSREQKSILLCKWVRIKLGWDGNKDNGNDSVVIKAY